jgi:hypothetical protein
MAAMHRNRIVIPATQVAVPQALLRQAQRRMEMPAAMGVVELALERGQFGSRQTWPAGVNETDALICGYVRGRVCDAGC